MNVGKI